MGEAKYKGNLFMKKGQSWAIILYGLGISGGANVIYQHAAYAVKQGIEVVFLTKDGQDQNTASWHKSASLFDYKNLEDAYDEKYDVVIATEWKSAFDCYHIKADKYFYFVQSIESRFFYNQDCLLAYVANMTYEMDFNYITEATWIKNHLNNKYHKEASLVLNGIDKDIFCVGVNKRKDSDVTRFLVEGSVSNWLKNVDKTIELCNKAGAEEIWLVTPDDIEDYPGVDKVFSKVPMSDMPSIYKSCDVLVKLSLVEGMFGPPLEMFHCGGTAITYDIEGSDEYLINEYNSIVVKKNDESSVVDAIKRLATDKELLNKLKKNAQRTANDWIDWDKSSTEFYEIVSSSPKISEQAYKNIMEKGKAGANAYRQIEYYFGMDPYKNNVEETIRVMNENGLDLYLFGAGAMCKSSIMLFSKYDCEIKGILVSNLDSNTSYVMGHKVLEVKDVIKNKDNIIIYITSQKYREEIYDMLSQMNFKYVL